MPKQIKSKSNDELGIDLLLLQPISLIFKEYSTNKWIKDIVNQNQDTFFKKLLRRDYPSFKAEKGSNPLLSYVI